MIDVSTLWRFDLIKGPSQGPAQGACVLDAVSWFEYGTLGDHPACVCPIIAEFARAANDVLSDAERQKLKAYIPRLVGTADQDSENARSLYLGWQAIRVLAPIVLHGLDAHPYADRMENVETLDEAGQVGPALAARLSRLKWIRLRKSSVDEARRCASVFDEATACMTFVGHAARARHPRHRAKWASSAAIAAGQAPEMTIQAAVGTAALATLDGVLQIGKQADAPDVPKMARAAAAFVLARKPA